VPKAAPLTSPPNGVSLAVALSCIALGLVVLTYYKLRLRLLLLWKDFFSSGDKNGNQLKKNTNCHTKNIFFTDPKEFDIFICYVTKDADFSVGELLPALEKRLHYQCCIHQLQPDGMLIFPPAPNLSFPIILRPSSELLFKPSMIFFQVVGGWPNCLKSAGD
jgi:hypothetical protein